MMPEDVRKAFFDEKTSDFIWQIGEKNHLSDDRIRIVARLTGYAILDLIHPANLARELENALHLDHRTAALISEEITNRIINPIIETPKTFHTPDLVENPTPHQKENIDPNAGLLTPAFKEKRNLDVESTPLHIDSQEKKEATSLNPIQETTEPQQTNIPTTPTPEPPITKPAEIPTTNVPEFEKPQTPPPLPQKSTHDAMPPPKKTPKPATTNVPAFERPSEPEPLLQPQMPTNEPAPFIIHEEEEIEPIASGQNAPLSRPHFFKSTVSEDKKEKAVSARLEIGGEPQTQEDYKIGRTKKEEFRVVNYTDPKLKVDPFKRPSNQTLPISESEQSSEEVGTAPIQKAVDTPPQNQTPKTQEKAPEPVTEKPTEISPENIVNLKDLPK